MSIVLTNKADKNQSIDILELVFRNFMFPAVGPDGRAKLTEHIEWMRRRQEDMVVDLRFETFPVDQATQLTLHVSFSNAQAKTI